MFKKIYITFFSLGFNLGLGYMQVIVNHNSPQNISRLSDIFNLTVENNLGITSYVFIEAEISEDSYGNLGLVRTEKFLLQNGQSIIDQNSLPLASKSFSSLDIASYIKNQGVFAAGKYKVQIFLKSATDNNSLTMTTVPFTVSKTIVAVDAPDQSSNQSGRSNTGFNPNFRMTGNAEVIGYYSLGQPSTSLMPPSYLQLGFNPQISLFDVPVGAKLFLTTQQSSTMQSMNYFSLNFDANVFRNALMKRMMDMVNKKANLDKMNLSNFDNYKNELSNINNTLKNPGVIQELSQIKELDSLKNQFAEYKDKFKISDTSLTSYMNMFKDSVGAKSNSLSKLDSIKTTYTDSVGRIKDTLMVKYEKMAQLYEKIKGMKWLDEKKQYYDQLLGKKEKIMDYGKKLGCIDSLGNFTDLNIEKFDAKKYSDPSILYSALKKNKLIKKYEKYLYWIKSVNIGMHSPVYSNMTLNGVNVNGFGITIEPYKFYASFSYGEALRPVITLNPTNANYKRNLWAFKIGYGRLEDSHIHFNMMSATDDTASINPRDSLFLYQKLPQDNKVMSIDFKLNLFKKKMSISGEIAGSQTIRDISFNANQFIMVGNPGSSPGNDNWFLNILAQNNSDLNRQVDYAVQVKIEGRFFKGSTMSGSFSRTGPRFQSFGLPFLLKDRMMGEFKASQKFWKNRLSFTGFFRYNVDNLDSAKSLTTQFMNYGLDVRINIPKIPSITVSLMPITLQNDSIVLNMNVLNSNVFHTFDLKKFTITSILNYTYQSSQPDQGNVNYFNLHNVNLNTIFTFIPFTLNNSFTYMNNVTSTGSTNTFIASLSTSFILFKKWTNTVGGNLYVNESSLKGGGFYQTSLNFFKNLSFNLRIETNRFNTYIFLPGYQDYTQFICRTSIQYKW